tara:strand:- start:140 stop:1072 length:933 start_codon:yes stop_codon:yes gene_type:complete
MSDLQHRTLPELKSFAKKYKEHFKLNVSKIRKAELLKRIDNGMLKAINPALQKGLKDEYERLKQPKGKKAVVKKETTEQVKKRVHKKVEKPKVEKPKVEKPKVIKIKAKRPKVKPSESKLLQVKGVGSVPPPKIKPPMATMKITPKTKAPKNPWDINVDKMNRKQLIGQVEWLGYQGDAGFESDEDLKKIIKKELKRLEDANFTSCQNQTKRLLNDLRDILLGNEKYAEIAKGYGKEKITYAKYRTKFIEGAEEIIRQHKSYNKICTDEELSNIKKGLAIMKKYKTTGQFNKRGIASKVGQAVAKIESKK